jgi:hypothetical protein
MLTLRSDVLDAVLSYRDVIRTALPETAREALERGEEVYIGVLAAGGWECEHFYASCLFLVSILISMIQ